MKGELTSFQLFDLGGTLDRATLERTIAHRGPRTEPPVGKGTPSYVEFPQPLVVDAGEFNVTGVLGDVKARATVRYYDIGSVCVRFQIPLDVADLSALAGWQRLRVGIDGQSYPLEEGARQLVQKERELWGPALRDRYTVKIISESYTAFSFHDVPDAASSFKQAHGAEIAALLQAEDGGRLYEREVQEATKRWFSYYEDDVIVVDWDAAFLIDPSREWDDLYFILEIANLQLLEFRSYDDYLDDAVAHSYDELEALFRNRNIFRSVRKTLHDLSLLRLEFAELSDLADNITKFLGDWFLARVYGAASDKFHLKDWRASVDDKLDRVNQLYQVTNAENDTQRLMTLEVLIVVLFILDLGIILWK